MDRLEQILPGCGDIAGWGARKAAMGMARLLRAGEGRAEENMAPWRTGDRSATAASPALPDRRFAPGADSTLLPIAALILSYATARYLDGPYVMVGTVFVSLIALACLGRPLAFMVSLAALFTPVFTLSLGALPGHLYSHGSSLLGTSQQVSAAIGTAEIVHTMTQADVYYYNANRKQTGTNAIDGRPTYAKVNTTQLDSAYVLSNTDEGKETTATIQLTRPFTNGITVGANYAWQDAQSVFDATSRPASRSA